MARSAAVCGGTALFIPMCRWKKFTPWHLIDCFMLLYVVLVLGCEINSARHWIHLGPINLQPTEMFKLVMVLYLSSFFTRRVEILKQAKKILFPGAVADTGLALMILQPDSSSFVVVTVVAMEMLFLAGSSWKYSVMMLTVTIADMVSLTAIVPYRMACVSAFFNPWEDPLGKGYQLTHSLMTIARDEWLGVELGANLEKRFYLSEVHTDFIFAVIGEEFGFMGICLPVFCYGWLMFHAFSISKQARDLELLLSAYVTKDVGIRLGTQSFFNIGVNTGILPTKGLSLSLMSCSGSSVVVMLLYMTLLLRIDYENRQKMRDYQVE